MREIQYRGKSISTGEWVYGNLIVDEAPLQCLTNEKAPNKYYIGKSGFADWNMPRPYQTVEVIESTIGQWTGLIDKDGTRIYEGDVDKDGGEVIWIVDSASFGVDYPDIEIQDLNDSCKWMKVIGNIHDKNQ